MSRQSGSATTRYYHRSGPRRDDDEDDVAYDYDYYDTYDDYRRSRDARKVRSRSAQPAYTDSEPLYDSSDDEGSARQRQRQRSGGDDTPRASRGRDIHLHVPRAAVTAGATPVGTRSASHNSRRGEELASRRPRSTPAGASPTYTTPRGRPPLPPNWLPLFSRAYDRWYYVNKSTGKPQWEAPGFEVSTLRELQRELQQKQHSLAPPRNRSPRAGSGTGSGHSRRNSSHSQNSRRSSGLSITGMLLGAAGGIAAGALVAKALKKDHSSAGSDRSVKRRSSHSEVPSAGDQRRGGNRSDRDDFEEDNASSYHRSRSRGRGAHDRGSGRDED